MSETAPYAVRCADCNYVHSNGPSNYVNLAPGNYCPECGRQFVDQDAETKREYLEAEGLWADGEYLYVEAADAPPADAEAWTFACGERDCSHNRVLLPEAEAYAVADSHEETTGHFRFDIRFEGALVDGV